MTKKDMRLDRQLLSDPRWQGLSGIFGFLSLILAILMVLFNVDKNDKKLSVEHIGVFTPRFESKDESLYAYSIKNEKWKNLLWLSVEITNTGKLPILPDDFISPLSVIASKHLKILNVFEHETKMQAKTLRTIELLRHFGPHLPMPHSRKISGHDLWELRIRQSSNICRLFYFSYRQNNYMITSGYIKKTDRTSKAEINRALRIRNDFEKEERI